MSLIPKSGLVELESELEVSEITELTLDMELQGLGTDIVSDGINVCRMVTDDRVLASR